MMSTTSSSTTACQSASLADDILVYAGDGNNKFVQPTLNSNSNATSNSYLTTNQVEISTSATNQSQTLKHFLAQKYAAESTSDGDTESHSNNNNTNNAHLPNQSNFSQTISNFYPFSPLVSSSSSHFDSRGILTDGVLESSIDSLQVESSTNNNEQISGHSSNHLFNDSLTPSIDTFIKQEDVEIANLPPPASTPTNVTSSSTNRTVVNNNNNNNRTNNIHLSRVDMVPSSLFDTVNSDITVDSTTINISQQQSANNQSSLSQLTFNNFPPSLNHHHQTSSLPSVLTYGLSPNFSNTFLQFDNSQQNLIAPLASPTIQSIEHYFTQQTTSNGLDKKEHENVILDQHQLLTTSMQPYTNDNHCLISDNSLSDNLFHDIPNENFNESEITHLQENIISDLPVLTRARASLPIEYLYLQETDNGLGIFARKDIPKRTQFGPIEGVIVTLPENQYSSNNIAYSSKNNLIIFISENMILSQTDENNSNWTRFVRPACNAVEQNLELITKEFSPTNEVKFYFYTTRNISPEEELKVWYSRDYAQTFNIKLLNGPTELNLLDENDLNKKQVESSNAINTTGHKLRNKMAKTQMIQNNNNGTTLQASKSLPDKLVDQTSSLNGSQIPDIFNSTEIIQMVSNESMLNVDSMIVQNEKINEQTTVNKTNRTMKNNNNLANGEKPKFQCDKCQKVFPRHYSLRRHLVMHSGEKRYKCPICGTAFNHVYNRNRHIKMHKGQNQTNEANAANNTNNKNVKNNIVKVEIEQTDICVLQNSNKLNKINEQQQQQETNILNPLIDSSNQNVLATKTIVHMDNQPSIDSSSSPSSSKDNHSDSTKMSDLVSSSGLDKSNKTNNNNNKNQQSSSDKFYRCSQCYKRFSTKERLEKHGIVHDESAKKLSCDVCDRKFLTNSALSCHIKYHQLSDEPRKYDCALCDKVFDNIQLRRQHVSVHINPNTGLFHCTKCPKTFEDFPIIRKHLKSFHSNEIFPCTECPKVFPRQDKLRLHMLCHIDRWEFKCNSCDKQFKRKDKLKEHTQRMHAPDRDIRIAAKIAARMQRLKVQRTKKVVTRPSQPNYHEYVYKCHLCLFGFKRRGMLVNHLAKRHPEIPYNTVPELNMPIVKTSKDYYCQYCEKVYKSSSKRKAHIIKNHPGKSLPPSNRNKTISSDIVNQTFSATVGSITINPHFCDWCHKQYASKAKLMQHQRKKHPEELMSNSSSSTTMMTTTTCTKQKQNGNVLSMTNNVAPRTTTTSVYKLNTNINGDKATFTTIPITTQTIKQETDSNQQMIAVDTTKIDHFLSDDSPSYMDGFTIANHHYGKDNGNFLNGPTPVEVQTTAPQVHYVIDSNDPVFEDIMNINIEPNEVNHHLNSISNSVNSNSSFTNNVITILACTNPSTGTTTFTSDLSEFSDIITQISDFQSETTKQIQLTNGTNTPTTSNGAGSTGSGGGGVANHIVTNESNSNDLLISENIVEENNWNQVCDEMAIV